MTSNHIVIIDGYSFLFRAFHSLPPLTNSAKTPVGAIYGFCSMLMKVIAEIKPTHLAIVFDSGQKNFRHEIYSEYKANRPAPPEELIPQFALVRELVTAMGIYFFEKEGYEADDIIRTIVEKAIINTDIEDITVISSDKDLMQLVGGKVRLYDSLKNKYYDAVAVKEKFGVAPEFIHDFLSLTGDSSDNIPGIPGVGPKTALELIEEFGHIDNLINNVYKIQSERRRKLVNENIDKLQMSYRLTELKADVPVELDFSNLEFSKICANKFIPFIELHGFKSLINRAKTLFNIAEVKIEQIEQSTKLVSSKIDFDELFNRVINQSTVAIHYDDEAILLATDESVEFRIRYQKTIQNNLDFSERQDTADPKFIRDFITNLLSRNDVKKIFFSFKDFLYHIDQLNITLATSLSYDDISVMSYILNAGLFEQTQKEILSDDLSPRGFFAIYQTLFTQIKEQELLSLYIQIERPLPLILYQMEKRGILIDNLVLSHISGELGAKLKILESNIFTHTKIEFNLASPKQLGEVLFDNLGIPGGKKSKAGTYSTDVEILEDLVAKGYDFIQDIINWRALQKLKSTYSDALPKLINPLTSRLHTNYSQVVTTTGRLSSSNPNLQNIPIRSTEGKLIRKAFIAPKGKILISCDYSQIELRLLAHLAHLPSLKKAFLDNQDIHKVTASEMFHVPLEQVDDELRRKAKTINFGIIYGISSFGLSRRIGIPIDEAEHYINKYFEKYPGIKEYMDKNIALARKFGYVKSLYGRIVHTPKINDKIPSLRHFAERAAINAPLQATASDIIKKAMILINNAIVKNNLPVAMLLQVHDELIFESDIAHSDTYATEFTTIMESVADLEVPLIVNHSLGFNWEAL